MKFAAKTSGLVAAAICGFALLEYALFLWADRPLAFYIFGLQTTQPGLIGFFQSITDLGKAQWYLWPCGLATIFCGFLTRGKDVPQRYRRLCAYVTVRSFFLFGTIALSGIAADIVKPIVGRARPWLLLHKNIYGFAPFTASAVWNGMPSGHTTTAVALAFSLSTLYPRLRVLWFAYALVLGVSRIMVDAHYLSDVIAGAMLGWLTVHLFVRYGMIHVWRVIFPIDSRIGPM
jgi:undecaprenyl-diphosphatase